MIVRFGDCEVDIEGRELRLGRQAVHVEPQVFDLLTYLIANRGRVASRDEIIEAVWHGRIVSDATLSSRINAARRAIGDDGRAQAFIRTVARRGFRFVGDVRDEAAPAATGAVRPPPEPGPAPRQEVRFCRTADGVNLAVATSGSGSAVVKTGTWLTHVEHDLQSPVWSPLFTRLASQFRLIRYDPRGCGLSDWEVEDISFEGFVRDLETVADALSLGRFALYGISQGAAVAVTYAARHPERVSCLVISGGFPLGWRNRGSAAEIATREAIITLIQHGWGQDNPAFQQVFAARLWPDMPAGGMQSLNAMQRTSTSPENAVRIQRAIGKIDVVKLLPLITAPTLVLHSRNDAAHPRELGLMFARQIPGARFVEVESRNHIPLSHEPAWQRYVDEVCDFLHEKAVP
jgi:pimeloyl-ACP methyl ester carboxylesterase/DNA-binding winged helix-turn-helix (wHTH) protein